MTNYCVSDQHALCPDSRVDTGDCSCPCHMKVNGRQRQRRVKARTDRRAGA